MDDLLAEQREYYRARAPEYDEWFLREGRYDRGPNHRAAWFAELGVVQAALAGHLTGGTVLEMACGTGMWTQHLADTHDAVVALDASPEAIAINQARIRGTRVSYQVADLFAWEPPSHTFDAVFFGFWLSHVPAERFEAFWAVVKAALKRRGRVFFVDSLFEPAATASNHDPIDHSGIARRKLNDGREFRVVKVFYEPTSLQERLATLGWSGQVRSTGSFFLYGSMSPTG